jgi:hypothetical protein
MDSNLIDNEAEIKTKNPIRLQKKSQNKFFFSFSVAGRQGCGYLGVIQLTKRKGKLHSIKQGSRYPTLDRPLLIAKGISKSSALSQRGRQPKGQNATLVEWGLK